MLKKKFGLFLGLVVLAGSACVTPTHASSAHNVIITYVQAGGASGAKEELTVLYNASMEPVDMTGTCLMNKSNAAFACFNSAASQGQNTIFMVPSFGYLTVASEEYVSAHSYARDFYSLVYAVTNQSSGSIVGSTDSISVVDAQQEKANSRSWTTSLASGKAWVRIKLISQPDIYAINNEATDWTMEDAAEPPQSALTLTVVPSDTPEDTPGGEIPQTPLPPIITELLANPAGSDVDGEYIELYNPNDTQTVSLDGLKLRIGTDSPKWYTFPAQTTIAPQSYLSFSNSELGFTLVNTTGRVQLFNDTVAVGDVIEYVSPEDGQAWAFISGTWTYTSRVTPGAANELVLQIEDIVDAAPAQATSEQKPCVANQYRNPETGRCKLIASTAIATTPTPCKEGQERNPETNRCRAVTAAETTPTPCKEGQERNPETNRCRVIVKMTNADYKVLGAADSQPRWYYWLTIVIIIGLVVAYAVWEWREELRTLWARVRGLVRK